MSFNLQNKIRQDANDFKDYLKDLSQWEKLKENTPSNNKGNKIRPERESSEAGQKNLPFKLKKENKRDAEDIKEFYQKWNHFDVVILKGA